MSLGNVSTRGGRVDWYRVMMDLRRKGISVAEIVRQTDIPSSTLMGYTNLDVEPRHADGVQLVALWQSVMCPPLPTQEVKPRVRRVTSRAAHSVSPNNKCLDGWIDGWK